MVDYSIGDLVMTSDNKEGICIVASVVRNKSDEQLVRLYNEEGKLIPVGEGNWYSSHCLSLLAKSSSCQV
jgi:hypothetical protein